MNVKTQANNKFTLVAAGAAAVLVISFFLPWMTASFGGFGSVSMSWVDYITTAGSPWAQDVQSLLVVAAAVAAPVCAFLVFVQGRRSQAFLGATLLSFVGAAIGSAWLLVQFNQTFGGETGMAPGLGLWLYLVASLVGAGASFRLFNPASASLLPRLAGSAPKRLVEKVIASSTSDTPRASCTRDMATFFRLTSVDARVHASSTAINALTRTREVPVTTERPDTEIVCFPPPADHALTEVERSGWPAYSAYSQR